MIQTWNFDSYDFIHFLVPKNKQQKIFIFGLASALQLNVRLMVFSVFIDDKRLFYVFFLFLFVGIKRREYIFQVERKAKKINMKYAWRNSQDWQRELQRILTASARWAVSAPKNSFMIIYLCLLFKGGGIFHSSGPYLLWWEFDIKCEK